MKEFRESYYRESSTTADFRAGSYHVWCYRGNIVPPKWHDIDTNNYTKLCTIEADLSRVPLLPRPTASGYGSFYRVDYDIILLFGLTELKAQVAWKENGREKRQVSFFFLKKEIRFLKVESPN